MDVPKEKNPHLRRVRILDPRTGRFFFPSSKTIKRKLCDMPSTSEDSSPRVQSLPSSTHSGRPTVSRKGLIDLPNEMLQLIVERLDRESFFSFAFAHPRLTAFCQEILPLIRFISPDPLKVRTLNLAGCRSESKDIKEVIRRCNNLEELNVENSALTLKDLMDVLRGMRKVNHVSFSFADSGEFAGVYGFSPRRIAPCTPPS